MGGATHFNKNKKKWNRIFTNIVNGQVKNVYSKSDRILLLYTISELDFKPAGRHRVKVGEEDPDEVVQEFQSLQSVRIGEISSVWRQPVQSESALSSSF